jgi:hypothetical protein
MSDDTDYSGGASQDADYSSGTTHEELATSKQEELDEVKQEMKETFERYEKVEEEGFRSLQEGQRVEYDEEIEHRP